MVGILCASTPYYGQAQPALESTIPDPDPVLRQPLAIYFPDPEVRFRRLFPPDNLKGSAFHIAVAHGDQAAVENELKWNKTLVNTRLPYGYSALGIAARIGDKAMIQFLLDHGADLQAAVPGPHSLLNEAVWSGDKEVVRFLLDKGLDIANPQGISPLNAAVESDNREMVKLLLARGADPTGKGSQGPGPITTAIYRKRPDIMELLLNKGVSPNPQRIKEIIGTFQSAPLHAALELGDEQVVALLIKWGADPLIAIGDGKDKNAAPLMQAIALGRKDLVAAMIGKTDKINRPDADGQTLLHRALTRSQDGASLATLLLANGADVNAPNGDGLTPLHVAVQSGASANVAWLLHNKAALEAKTPEGDTALHLAALSAPAVGNVLLEAGEDANVRNNRGDLPLHVLLRQRPDLLTRGSAAAQAFCVALLKHTDLNSKDHYGFTPLQAALINRDISARDAIVALKPKLDSVTAAFAAAASNDVTALQKQLDEKPYLTAIRLPNGFTPLHIAALWHAKETAALLLERAADVNARDADAYTPLARIIHDNTGLTGRAGRAGRVSHDQDREPQDDIVNDEKTSGQRFHEMVAFLVEKGADVAGVDEDDNTLLHTAVLRGDKDLVSLLLSKGLSPKARNKRKLTPLNLLFPPNESQEFDALDPFPAEDEGAGSDKQAIFRLLVAKGADTQQVDKNGNTFLMNAVAAGNKDLVAALLEAGADVNVKNKTRETPLACVIRIRGQNPEKNELAAEIARLLLAKGASPFVPARATGSDQELLDYSLQVLPFRPLGKVLVENIAADPQLAAEHDLVQRVILSGNQEMVAYVIKQHLDLNARGKYSLTPLMNAVYSSGGRTEIVALLLNAGADVNGTSGRGYTALDIAVSRGFKGIADMLLARGAKASGKAAPVSENGRQAF